MISPLLANIYLNLIDKAVNRPDGEFRKYGVKIVRYADDFILMAKKIPEHCIEYLHSLVRKDGAGTEYGKDQNGKCGERTL